MNFKKSSVAIFSYISTIKAETVFCSITGRSNMSKEERQRHNVLSRSVLHLKGMEKAAQ